MNNTKEKIIELYKGGNTIAFISSITGYYPEVIVDILKTNELY